MQRGRSTNVPGFHSSFTDKESFFDGLSVSKTHFTDKSSFSGDLSVNFWPLCWEFTDKRLFLEHLSVKPGPKRLNFYGQTAVFAHFVRNRHFSSRSFTDRRPIFIDVSVNGRDFCQMQRLINQRPSSQSKIPPNYFWLFPSWKAIIRFFDLRRSFFPASFRLDINKTIIMKLFVK